MRKRNSDAIAISDGASNPRAIINAMKRAIDELVEEGTTGTDDILRDPALKLMTHHLAFLQGIPTSETLLEWVAWRDACGDTTEVEVITLPEPPERRAVPRLEE